MFEKVKKNMDTIKNEAQKKSLNKKQKKLEKAAAKERQRQEELKVEIMKLEAEKAKIEAEKERLKQLGEKDLMVELIFAIRGVYSQFASLVNKCEELAIKVGDCEATIRSLEYDINSLQIQISDSNNRYSSIIDD